MYFQITTWLGLFAALVAMVGTRSWYLLGLAVAMFFCNWLQVKALSAFTEVVARRMFGVALCVQCALSIVTAVTTNGVGVSILAAGTIANTVVVMLNGWRMPFMGVARDKIRYVKFDEHTRASWLCDRLGTTETTDKRWLISAGDALECIGIWVLAAEVVLARLL